MTGEEFQREYTLQEKVDDGDVVTHRAVDSSGNRVLVHFLVKDVAGSRTSLLNFLPSLDRTDAARILTLTEVDEVTVMVTEPLEDFTTLGEWLKEAAGGKVVKDPGVYTRLLGTAGETGEVGETAVVETSRPVPPEGEEDGEAAGEGDLSGREPPGPESGAEGTAEKDPDRDAGPPDQPSKKKKKRRGRPGAFTMVFGEDHGLRDASPEDIPALAETRVTPTSGGETGTGSTEDPEEAAPKATPELAETRITPVSGNTITPESLAGGTRSEPGEKPPEFQPPPPEPPREIPDSPPTTQPPYPEPARSMSPAVVWGLVVLALILGVVAGVFLLG